MTGPREWIPGRLVRAALDVPQRVTALGPAVWLYLYLLVEVGHDGRLCRQSTRIASDLGVTEPDVASWVTALASAGLIIVLSPSPYLVLKLPLWSGNASNQARVPLDARDSYRSNAIEAINNRGEDRGQGEGEELLREILETLGETDSAPFRRALDHFAPSVIRHALERVRAAKPGQIRKTKTAYFRFLLGRLSNTPTP